MQAMKEIKNSKKSKSVKFSNDISNKPDLPDDDADVAEGLAEVDDIDMEFNDNDADDGDSEDDSERETKDSENETEDNESEAEDVYSESEAEATDSESDDDESEAGDNELDTVHFEETRSEDKEDIYGRLLDKDGNVKRNEAGSYIPPGRRLLNTADDEKKKAKLDRIKKLFKGLINR